MVVYVFGTWYLEVWVTSRRRALAGSTKLARKAGMDWGLISCAAPRRSVSWEQSELSLERPSWKF
jgi:hypothetical protein